MIFYHLTRPEHVKSIMREGLRAACNNPDNDLTGGIPVVWLTIDPTLVPTLKVRKLMLRRGILAGPRCSNLPEATMCLRVIVPTTDCKLYNHKKWLRKQSRRIDFDPDDPLLNPTHWIYIGDIPPDRITKFKEVPKGDVYRELPDIRKAYLAGAAIKVSSDVEAYALSGAWDDTDPGI